jgi:tripartite-type tricarboxylate transporter receptor subunit TctC
MKKQLLFLCIALAGLTVCLFAGGSKEQGAKSGSASLDYPKKAIQVIVPANAGGATDISARLIAKYMEKELGQSVVIVNMAGAGGSLASRKVKDSDPDGYTALYWHNGMLINKLMGIADFSYDAFQVAGIVIQDNSNSFYVRNKSDIKDLKDLVAKAKEKPETLTYATETGSFTHLQGLAFQEATGIKFNIVDVGTDSQKIAALMGNKIDVMPGLYSSVRQYVESGDFRILGFFSERRNPLVPQVPTAKEQGIDFIFDGYYFGLFFPKSTPKAIVDKVSETLGKVASNQEFLTEANKMYFEVKFLNGTNALEHIEKVAAFYDKFKDKIKKN